MILRPYQSDDVSSIYHALRHVRSVMYTLPTGGGKTVVFGQIAKLCAEYGTTAAILVHRDTLLQQACAKLDDFGVKYSVIAPGRTDFGDRIHVASVNTLVRRRNKYQFDFLIIDEGHHAIAGSYKRIIDAYPEASVLGVTATPCRLDGRGLKEVFDRLVHGPSIRELMNDGYLTEAVSYGSSHIVNLGSARTVGGDYNLKDLQEAMDRREITGDAVEHYARLCKGVPAVAFCVTIQHAKDVAAMFREAGYRARSVDGTMPLKEIRTRVDGLKTGSLQVLTSCELVSEGFDAPGVVASILLRPTKSMAVYMQQVGRALRPIYGDASDTDTRSGRLAAIRASCKPHAIILDHAGNSFRFGLVDESRVWSLDAPKRRASAGEISIRQCPNCFACCRVHKKSCPQCGHIFVINLKARIIQQVDGKLTKLDKIALAKMRRAQERRARTYAELVQLGISRGYSSKWAYLKWLGRGGDPSGAVNT